MKDRKNSPDCERARDLIAFLYNEADEDETRDFQRHLQECNSCRDEVASFGAVRQSITTWRDEALSSFVSSPVVTKPNRKSALAALRQFFDLSPLWLKGATALAAVTFCVLAGLAIVRRDHNQVPVANVNADKLYTQHDIDRIVQEALAKQEKAKPAIGSPSDTFVVKPSKPKTLSSSTSSQFAKSRRPLSKAEREQLAAELRLLSTRGDATLNLLGDRINQ